MFGVARSHGTPMRRLVEHGALDPARYVQIGLRGYWPGEAEFAWQREQGITSLFMHDVAALGIEHGIDHANLGANGVHLRRNGELPKSRSAAA